MLSFKWRHFKQDIILMLVRWYLAYSLSYRDVEELALEPGLKVDHSTINRWVIGVSRLRTLHLVSESPIEVKDLSLVAREASWR